MIIAPLVGEEEWKAHIFVSPPVVASSFDCQIRRGVIQMDLNQCRFDPFDRGERLRPHHRRLLFPLIFFGECKVHGRSSASQLMELDININIRISVRQMTYVRARVQKHHRCWSSRGTVKWKRWPNTNNKSADQARWKGRVIPWFTAPQICVYLQHVVVVVVVAHASRMSCIIFQINS